MAEQTKTYSTVELTWETVLRAEDEERGIILEVALDESGGFRWAALDDDGFARFLGAPRPDVASAQAAAVAWWREQVES